MTDSPKPAESGDPAQAKPPAEWKPEPRQWTWKDLFTAPMLAFKPKCMAISALTLVALGLWHHLFASLEISPNAGWYWPVFAGFLMVGLAVFGLGATLVATFMKADLLDDEFLSFGEAFAQFKQRLLPAVLVPLFLVVLTVGVHALMVWLPMFVCSAPWAGSLLYGLLYPLAFAATVFAVLLLIAVFLSLFVFPAIIAIRRHGWFDNVVDTVEAVGTKPHVLVASLLLAVVMILVSYGVGSSAMSYLRNTAGEQPAWGEVAPEPLRAEVRAREISVRAMRWIDPIEPLVVHPYALGQRDAAIEMTREGHWWYRWFSGLALGFWQVVIWACILGYCLNLLIGSGMLTYLLVREDDYWDDEDLEDLDKLAKELEEEAKREDAGQPAQPQVEAPAATPAPEPPKPA